MDKILLVKNVHFVYSPINTFASQLRDFQSSVEYQTQRILQTENSFVISITCDDTALLLKEGQNIRVRIPNISKTVDKALYESITLDDDLIKFWKRTGSTNSIEKLLNGLLKALIIRELHCYWMN